MKSKQHYFVPKTDTAEVYAFTTLLGKAIAQNEAEGPSVLKATEKDPNRFSNSVLKKEMGGCDIKGENKQVFINYL